VVERTERRVHWGSFQASMRGCGGRASAREPTLTNSSCGPGSSPGRGLVVVHATCPSPTNSSTT